MSILADIARANGQIGNALRVVTRDALAKRRPPSRDQAHNDLRARDAMIYRARQHLRDARDVLHYRADLRRRVRALHGWPERERIARLQAEIAAMSDLARDDLRSARKELDNARRGLGETFRRLPASASVTV